MPPSSGQISLSYGGTEVIFSAPEVGYLLELRMPFDFIKLDDKSFDSRDEGIQYDKRLSKHTFYLTTSEQSALNTLINTTARGKSLVLTLPSGSGFFPFGPDKGDEGVFTVAATFDSTPMIQLAPFRYFKCNMTFSNVGVYPAYSLPTQIPEGPFTIGTIADCRMPQSLFAPKQEYAISVEFTESNRAEYIDRGSGGDNATTQFNLQCNESKCAALLNYLTHTARAGTFTITTADSFYIFGSDHGSDDTYTVRMISNMITVKHVRYNEFELSLELQRIS